MLCLERSHSLETVTPLLLPAYRPSSWVSLLLSTEPLPRPASAAETPCCASGERKQENVAASNGPSEQSRAVSTQVAARRVKAEAENRTSGSYLHFSLFFCFLVDFCVYLLKPEGVRPVSRGLLSALL